MREQLHIYNKVIAFIFLLVNMPSAGMAQEDSTVVCNSHSVNVRSLVVPAAVFGVSALFTSDGWCAGVREDVQDALSDKGRHKIRADEYLRFAPSVAISALNLTKIKSKHGTREKLKIRVISFATMLALTKGMKCVFNETRPDGSDNNSFPSGHTATAFMGAEFLYREYHDTAPWVGYTGYALAGLTGYLRIYNNKHWINDVVAGACLGVASTKIAYWMYPKIFRKSDCRHGVQLVGLPYYDGRQAGISMSMAF